MPKPPAPHYPSGLTRRDVVAWRNAIFAVFGLSGVNLASWVARVPRVRDVLQANTLEMGLLIFGLAAGSIVGLLFSSHLIARYGTRSTIVWALIAGSLGLAGAGLAITAGPSFAGAFAGLAVFGAGAGVCDVAMNLSGAVSERVLGRSTMSLYHAFFSFGTMVGAGVGALAEVVRLPIALHTGAVAAVAIAVALAAGRRIQSETVADTGSVPSGTPAETWRSRLRVWRDGRTILLGLIVLGMAFSEGSANDWLALAMVDGHHVGNATGAVVFGVFVAAMTLGRVSGGALLDRYGRVPVLRASAALAAAGLLLVIAVPVAWIAVIGTVLWGLGSSLGFPVGMSAAADDPRTAAARVSAVATIAYCAFLVGPPGIGLLGEHVGLLNALLVVLALIVTAGATAPAARKPRLP